ncbi:MAG: hypothetical protein JWN46_629 [Acidimicrobiales bacterium]|nr:hypothetical protein [Acidimicrobiales bacterium]
MDVDGELPTAEQVRALITEVASLRDKVARLEARAAGGGATAAAAPRPDAGAAGGAPDRADVIGRRSLLRSLGTAAAAGTGIVVGATVLGSQPSNANHIETAGGGWGHLNDTGTGNVSGASGTNSNPTFPLVILQNLGSAGTLEVKSSSSSTIASVKATNSGAAPGLSGESASSNAVEGHISQAGNGFNALYATTAGTGNGVFGEVTNSSSSANAVLGIHKGTGNSVFGFKGPGVAGDAVVGVARTGRGLLGVSDSAIGVQAQGGQAPLLLVPAGSPGSPTSGPHVKGELYTDSDGSLWSCVVDAPAGGTGTWRKLAGPTSAGTFHVLPAPVRVYDSRPGTFPSTGPKTPLSANTARTLDVTVNNSGVPMGATAVTVNLLLVNAVAGNGNFTIWANGVARPQANNMVWGGNLGRYSSLATTAISSAGQVQVLSAVQTDFVLDVVGYYR